MEEGEWNSLLETMGRTENYTLSVQLSDKLMTFNQDYFFLVWGNFLFCCGWGSVSPFPYTMAVFEATKAGNIGTFHLGRASSK